MALTGSPDWGGPARSRDADRLAGIDIPGTSRSGCFVGQVLGTLNVLVDSQSRPGQIQNELYVPVDVSIDTELSILRNS